MRFIYTTLLIFSAISLFAQEARLLKRTGERLEVTEVVLLDSFPSSQLYYNSTLFLSEAFQGVREMSQLKDPKAKSVATKGSFPVSVINGHGEEIKAKVVFTLIIQCRENAYKYSLNDFYFAYTEETGITSYASLNDRRGLSMSPRQWQEVEKQTEEFVSLFVEDLKEQMSQQEILCKEMVSLQKKKAKGK